MQPIISAIVARESASSSNQLDDDTTNRNIIFTNNTNNNNTNHVLTIENPLTRNTHDNPNTSTDEDHQLNTSNQPQSHTNIHRNAPRQIQYLVSHFFTAQNKTSTNPGQTRAPVISNNTATDNNNSTNDNIILHISTNSRLNGQSTNIISNTTDSVFNSSIA
jgi:hypothetical protein